MDNKEEIIIKYDRSGQIIVKYYYKNNELHNTDGPAIIEYDENKNIINQKFYLNGKQIDELTILVNI